jgi:predicted phage terminase large subunit-like protein
MTGFKFNSQTARPQAEVNVDTDSESSRKPPVESGDEEPLVMGGVTFPREASARIRAMSTKERSAWDADRLRAMTDPIYLSGVLGMDLQEHPHRMLFRQLLTLRGPDFPLAELDAVHKKMVLWPRGVAKTTSVRVLMVSIILNYPNARLCFLTGGDQLAKRQLAALKLCFEKPTKRFQDLFPEFCLKSVFNKKTHHWNDINPAMGTTQQFSVPCRTTTVYAEPTFAISTPKSVKSGAHFDFLFIDDIVNDQNYQNGAALEKCYQQYLDTCPLLDPQGWIIMTGTVYSHADTYAKIQENAATVGELSVWNFSVRDCWSQGTCECGHPDIFHDRDVNIVEPHCLAADCDCKGFRSDGVKCCLFPRVKLADGRLFGHTLEFLNQQRAEMGETKFANQYENRVTAVGQQQFTEAMIGAQTVFEPSQLPPYQLSDTFIVGDLGYSIEEGRDETVLLVFKKYVGALWFFDCEAGHWGSNEFVERTLKLINKYRPKQIYYEKNQAADSLNNLLIARALDFQIYKIPIVWVPVSNQKDAKLTRISGIQALLLGKRVWLYRRMPNYDKLVKQLLRFPRSGHDDYADAMGMACEAPTGFQFESTPQQQHQHDNNWLHKLHPAMEPGDQYYDSGCGTGFCA